MMSSTATRVMFDAVANQSSSQISTVAAMTVTSGSTTPVILRVVTMSIAIAPLIFLLTVLLGKYLSRLHGDMVTCDVWYVTCDM